MSINFQAVGDIAVNSVDAFVDLVAPACVADDILIAVLLGKDNIDHSMDAGGWTEIGTQTNNTTAMTTSHWWKRAVSADSGATFRFNKATDNNIFFAGVISAWRGCITSATPIDSTTPTVSNNASSDTVTYADFNPTATDVLVIASGIYADDLTTAGAISGTNPAFTNNYDLETGTGTDCSFFGYSGQSDGAATGARSHSTTSMADAINQGWLFGLLPLAHATVAKTVGSSGTFSTPALWESGAPANLTTAEKRNAGTFAVAAFQQGEALTFTGSGATGVMLDTDSTGPGNGTYLTYGVSTGQPLTGDVATGGTSLGTCVLSGAATNRGIIWEGQCQNQEFSGAGTQVTIAGSTALAGEYKHLTTVAGASFRDNANVQTNALRYNASNGAAIQGTSAATTTVLAQENYNRISNLQVSSTGSSSSGLNLVGTNTVANNLVVEGTYTGTSTGSGVLALGVGNTDVSTIKNSVFILRTSAADHIVGTGTALPSFYNCTFVASDDHATAPVSVFLSGASGTVTVQNCAIFAGDSTKAIKAGSATFNFTTCYSDISGTSGVTQTTYGNAFENVNDATHDFRLKSGSALIDTGTTDATNAANDIAGTARPSGAAYDVGCWELVAVVAAGLFVTGSMDSVLELWIADDLI